MKKIFVLILVLLLMLSFSACGGNMETPEPDGGESVTSESTEFSESSGTTSLPSETDETAENDIINRIREIAPEKLVKYAENAHLLEDYGISQKASNVVVNGDGTLSFDLTLEKGGVGITENIRGFWLYYREDHDPNLNWGGYSFTDNGYLAVCGIEQIILINLDDFSVLDINFDFPETEGFSHWINGVVYDKETGWIISSAKAAPNHLHGDPMVWEIFVFDENGKFLNEYLPTAEAPYGGWADFATPSVMGKCKVLEKGGKTYYSFDYRCYCPDDGKSYQGSSIASPYDAETDGYRVYFYSAYDISNTKDAWLSSSGKSLGYYAVLKDTDENILGFFPTGENHIEVTYDDNTGKQTLELTHHGGLRFTLKNSLLAKSMELDFEKGTYTVEYNYTDENLAELIATSADGAYSLYRAGIQSGGEAYFYEVALKNNKTGEITHVAHGGTDTGSFCSEGFLKNGDFYIFSSSGLRIYSPESGKVIFDIEDNFSLSPDGDGKRKMLFTFRRNPKDFSYIVLYAEYAPEEITEAFSSNDYPYTMPFSLRVAYLDSEGRLIKSFDSKINPRADFFGFEYIEMRYSEEELLFVTSGGKGYNGIQFTFDRRTETFSEPIEAE